MSWTKKRLQEAIGQRLNGTKLVVVANREPYIHTYEGGEIHCMRPASGLTTALDPVMQVCGGVWIAHGSGAADREVVDEHDRVQVPDINPKYTLRRVWLNSKEEQGYYYGFSNDAIWPLCHVAYTRPRFDSDDWRQYRIVNQKFADTVLEEIGDEPAIVFVQDYHFALLPRMLKEARDDLVVAQFWHIPWPNREVFRVCPWHDEILEGLLGNDLLSFHIQYHCNNFLDTIDRSLEAKVDMEHFSITRHGHTTKIRPFPISIDPEAVADLLPSHLEEAQRRIRTKLGLKDEKILVGVDRVDYTKGIPERFAAVDSLLKKHPALKGKFIFVQIGAPGRTQLPIYQRLNEQLNNIAEEINRRHGQSHWRPIIFLNEHHTPWQICTLFRLAAGCVVSSLHDGMNLVAKEFVASRTDHQGVLILSRFTGAARELPDALLINPYAIDDFSDAMYTALTMPPDEQEKCMVRMRQNIEDNNIYRWAGMLLSEASKMIRVQQPAGASI